MSGIVFQKHICMLNEPADYGNYNKLLKCDGLILPKREHEKSKSDIWDGPRSHFDGPNKEYSYVMD